MSPLALAVIGPTILTTTNDIDQDVPTAAAAAASKNLNNKNRRNLRRKRRSFRSLARSC